MNKKRLLNLSKHLLPACGSGLLLTLAYAPFGWTLCAWFALVPLLCQSLNSRPRRAFALAWVAGFAHWVSCCWWVGHVTIGGMLLLSAYCALYWTPLPLLLACYASRCGTEDPHRNLIALVLGTAAWVGLEWIRSHFLTGFAWNTLAISQAPNTAFIQIADLAGTYGISFLIVASNLVLALAWFRRSIPRLESACVVALLLLTVLYGLTRAEPTGQPLRVSLVQTNIPQSEKWAPQLMRRTYDTLNNLTRRGAEHQPPPDLIVWPETAVPLYLHQRDAHFFLEHNVHYRIPILVGIMREQGSGDQLTSYNSTTLFDGSGRLRAHYDKRHLVLFGEYLPLGELLLPIFQRFTVFEANFQGGSDPAIMHLPNGVPFGALICFEDVQPYLARDSVRAGARLLVNQTNNAWFDPSGGSRQHRNHAIFRAIEHRVPIIRCTNTGSTVVIDTSGRLRAELPLLTADLLTAEISVPTADYRPTLTTRFGEWFGLLCTATLPLSLLLLRRTKPTKRVPQSFPHTERKSSATS